MGLVQPRTGLGRRHLGEQCLNCRKWPGGLRARRDKPPSPAPRQGLVTKHSSRGQTHYLLPASCRHAGPDIQLDVNQLGGHWPPPHTHRCMGSGPPTRLWGWAGPVPVWTSQPSLSSLQRGGGQKGADAQRTFWGNKAPPRVLHWSLSFPRPHSADGETKARRGRWLVQGDGIININKVLVLVGTVGSFNPRNHLRGWVLPLCPFHR